MALITTSNIDFVSLKTHSLLCLEKSDLNMQFFSNNAIVCGELILHVHRLALINPPENAPINKQETRELSSLIKSAHFNRQFRGRLYSRMPIIHDRNVRRAS